jgi:pimeloyl-ACP methyl ester carboxylesterase
VKKIVLVLIALVLVLVIGIVLIVMRPGNQSQTCLDFYAGMDNPPAEALAWCEAGGYFTWKSALPVNAEFDPLNIFQICQGNPDDPAIVMIHGYPTSSFDFAPLFKELNGAFYVCALDTPGYGFSDKPRDNFDYSISDDAQLVDYYIRKIVKLDNIVLLTHDKGDSVGLALLKIYQAYDEKPYTIKHHFITNGNIYLPLAQLTGGQKALLNPISGPLLSSVLPANRFAHGLAELAFATPLPQDEIASYATIFDYQNGTRIQHEIIEYLNERTENEADWLKRLGNSDIPTTIIWGELDKIAPLAVPNYVWENFLVDRETSADYWGIPCADHYLQVDTPDLVVSIIRASIEHEETSAEMTGILCQAEKIH